MNLQTIRRGAVGVVHLSGEHLDASNANEFKQHMGPLIERNPKLVLDLSEIRFMDSSGLGAILSCLRRVNAAGGELRLCGMTRPVRALFELVRMDCIFEIFDTEEEAVHAFVS